MKIYKDIEQNSLEWFEIRKGKFTCSTLSDLFMDKKTKGYNEAINKVVFERLTGEIPESFVNDYMKRGSELEPLARQRYELETFNNVEQVGFIEYSDWFGYSPDGLIGDSGLIEIKCPKFSTLIDFALTKKIPKEYIYQMQGGLLVSEREWCDFVMFHPKLDLQIVRVFRDEEIISEIQKVLAESVEEVIKRIDKIRSKNG